MGYIDPIQMLNLELPQISCFVFLLNDLERFLYQNMKL